MAQALDRWRPPPVLPRVVVSILATAVVSGLVTAALVTRDTRADDFRAAALASALTALSSFVGAVVIAALTRRLMPALWGYVPGLLGVLLAGLWLGESAMAAGAGGRWWVGALVLLNPLFWVPIWIGVTLAVRHRR